MSGSVEATTVVAVLALHAEYGSRMDGGDAEGLARLFTEDGVFSFEETDTTGWAALAEFARNSPVGIHVAGAPTVEAGPGRNGAHTVQLRLREPGGTAHHDRLVRRLAGPRRGRAAVRPAPGGAPRPDGPVTRPDVPDLEGAAPPSPRGARCRSPGT